MQPEEFNTFDSTVYATPVMKRSQVIPSRLAKREQTKMVRQTIAIGAVSIVVLLVFLFVIVPTVIRLAIDSGFDSSSFEKDTVPPQIPAISAPPAAVAAKELVLSGYGEPKSDIRVVLNNEEGPQVFAGEDGAFEITVQLIDNLNTISLYSLDEAGNESSVSRTYEVLSLTTPPKLVVSEPAPDQVFERVANQNISIKGETTPKAKVYVNDRLLSVDSEGIFQGSFRLAEGDNELTIKAVDLAGNEITQSLKVTFRY